MGIQSLGPLGPFPGSTAWGPTMKQKEPKLDDLSPRHAPLPVLPLRDVVVYPHMVIPLFVGREKSIRALDLAMRSNKRIVLVAQQSAEVDDPGPGDVYAIGTLANVLQLLRLPDGTVKVLVEGSQRVAIERFTETDPCFMVAVTPLEPSSEASDSAAQEVQALMRSLLSAFERYVKFNKKIPGEVLTSVSGIDDPHRVADTIAGLIAWCK